MLTRLYRLWLEEEAQDMVEYALLLGFVALSVVAIGAGIGPSVKGIWSGISSAFTAAS